MPPAVTDVLIGRTIAGKYVIESFLGGGAMGSVYRARQFALDKVVAIKVMRGELTTDRSFVGRFRREAKAASKLAHANSINVTDFGEESDGLLYLVMEFVAGRDLEQIMVADGVPLADARIAELLSQVLSAVAVAHDAGIVHRDLKPANILIVASTDDEGNPVELVKVCDFGIASMRSHDDAPPPASPGPPGVPRPGELRRDSAGKKLTAIGALLGTPEYMSPEQASGYALGPASDIYSIGAILYELLTGRTLYDADSPEAMVLKQIMGTPIDPRVLRPGCDDGLATICMRALEKKPEDRYASARAMRSELRILLGHAYGSRTATQQAIVIGTDSLRPASYAGSLVPSSLRPASSGASGAMQVHIITPMSGVPVSRNLRQSAETMAGPETLGAADTVPPPQTLPSGPPPRGALHAPHPSHAFEHASRTPTPPPQRSRGPLVVAALALAIGLGAAGFFVSRRPVRSDSVRASATEPSITQTVTTAHPLGAPTDTGTPTERSPSITTASAADVTMNGQPSLPGHATHGPSTAPRPGAAVAAAAGARSAATVAAAAPEPVAAIVAPAPAPAPTPEPVAAQPAAIAPAPVVVPDAPKPVFSPDAARVTATVTGAARTSRATVTSIVGHTSFDTCYRDALRSLGRPEGGAGTAHLEVDEDGIIANVQVRLPAPLSSAAPCFAAKLRGQRVANPDTGAATADVSFVLTPL